MEVTNKDKKKHTRLNQIIVVVGEVRHSQHQIRTAVAWSVFVTRYTSHWIWNYCSMIRQGRGAEGNEEGKERIIRKKKKEERSIIIKRSGSAIHITRINYLF